jgi:hypothetical protein
MTNLAGICTLGTLSMSFLHYKQIIRLLICGIFCCVIEEEGLQLHFDVCGLGCFCCLGFVLFAV